MSNEHDRLSTLHSDPLQLAHHVFARHLRLNRGAISDVVGKANILLAGSHRRR
jgi:hypothetical protein